MNTFSAPKQSSLTSSNSSNRKPNRYRFTVLEAAGLLRSKGLTPTQAPLQGAICKNCKTANHLTQRPIDNPSLLFCTNCGVTTSKRSAKYARGLAAPAIQQSPTGQYGTGIAQFSPSDLDHSRKKTRTHSGIHDITPQTDVPGPESLIKQSYIKIVDTT